MGFDQKGSLIFRVMCDDAGQWVVSEDGFDKPLAAFDAQSDALTYADDLAKAKNGSRVKLFDETGQEISAQVKY